MERRPPPNASGEPDLPPDRGRAQDASDQDQALRAGLRKHLTVGIPHHSFRERIAARPEEVRRALIQVVTHLSDLHVEAEDLAEIEVVLAESLNNVVEHAYANGTENFLIMKLDLTSNLLICRIEDTGTPMPNLAPPKGVPLDLEVDLHDLPEGGFGWFLIRQLTHDLRYDRQGECNRLTFWMPFRLST